MKLTNKDKNNLFWYLIVPSLSIITLLISLSPWFFELIATPGSRVFTGINRWSGDYFTYLSYVEQGVNGLLGVKLLQTTLPHPSLFLYLVYTIPGFIFGHIFSFDSVFIYHFFRAIYGLFFLLATFFLFYTLSKSKIITLLAFILTFYVSGFVNVISFFPFQSVRYLDWLQEQNIIGRATGPLHYNIGFIIFVGAFIYFFYSKANLAKKMIFFGLFLNGLLLSNPFNYVLMVASLAIYLGIKLIFFREKKEVFTEIIMAVAGIIISLPLLLSINFFLSSATWGIVALSPKFYKITTPPISILEAALSVGPIFFLGIFGLINLIFEKRKPVRSSIILFLAIWTAVQFFFLIYGNQLKIHPPRAFSGLYYLPLAYFSAWFVINLLRHIRPVLWKYLTTAFILFIFLLTLPNYFLSYKEQLFAFTDFKSFSQFVYPTKNQVEAFRFLEKNTPASSGILALYEASSLIIGFSGNSTEVNMEQKFKLPFYTNQLNKKQAEDFLKVNHFQYVYFGYQERSVGGNLNKYSFLKKIFVNPEVEIYQVL